MRALLLVLLLPATAAAQETSTTKPAIVFSAVWGTAHAADILTDAAAVRAVQAHEANPFMPKAQGQRYAVSVASAAGGAALSTYLWVHRHRWLAVAVTAADVGIRGMVARHNLAVAEGR